MHESGRLTGFAHLAGFAWTAYRDLMFATFVLDAYRWDERSAVAEALEGIASSQDRYGFASGGLYCFWDYSTRQVLYIGRAVDLPQRFRQHNGFSGRPKGCKLERIEAHFDEAELLGFSILVRSPNEQTSVARFRQRLTRDFGEIDDYLEEPEVRSETEMEIALAEGLAIRSVALATGALPPWNAIRGTEDTWATTMNRPDSTSELFTGTVNMLLQARSTIRELDADPTSLQFESVLLGARVRAAAIGIATNSQLSDYEILEQASGMERWPVSGLASDVQRIRDADYVLRKPWPMGTDEAPSGHIARLAWSAGQPLPVGPAPPRLREDVASDVSGAA